MEVACGLGNEENCEWRTITIFESFRCDETSIASKLELVATEPPGVVGCNMNDAATIAIETGAQRSRNVDPSTQVITGLIFSRSEKHCKTLFFLASR